jgi:hypothetical protein
MEAVEKNVVNLQMTDGAIYTGQIDIGTGLQDGHGCQKWADGAQYTGDFV